MFASIRHGRAESVDHDSCKVHPSIQSEADLIVASADPVAVSAKSKKDVERALRFLMVAEFWAEQGDSEQVLTVLAELKKLLLPDSNVL